MKAGFLFIVSSIIALTGCPSKTVNNAVEKPQTAQVDNTCDYISDPRDEFTFLPANSNVKKYGYSHWSSKESVSILDKLMSEYQGVKGKIDKSLHDKRITSSRDANYVPALLETCEVVYYRQTVTPFTTVYFQSEYDALEKSMGSTFWVNKPLMRGDFSYFTTAQGNKYSFSNLEPLALISFKLYNRGLTKFEVTVKNSAGVSGSMLWPAERMHAVYPIKQNWDPAIIRAIKESKIMRGMNREQLLLSWGEPKKTNSKTGAYGTRDQLVYGGGYYVYLKNGIIDSWQTSN